MVFHFNCGVFVLVVSVSLSAGWVCWLVIITSVTNREQLKVTYSQSLARCIETLKARGKSISAPGDTPIPWCNATWDTVLCWEAIPANSSATQPCPPMKGLDTKKFVVKDCDGVGRWQGKDDQDYSNPWGWTNYMKCLVLKNLMDSGAKKS